MAPPRKGVRMKGDLLGFRKNFDLAEYCMGPSGLRAALASADSHAILRIRPTGANLSIP
jgi:hypothetical protein